MKMNWLADLEYQGHGFSKILSKCISRMPIECIIGQKNMICHKILVLEFEMSVHQKCFFAERQRRKDTQTSKLK